MKRTQYAAEFKTEAVKQILEKRHPATEVSSRLGVPALRYHPSSYLTPTRWPHHFFVRASFRISALSRSSAYIFLSRAFSSSSSLTLAIMDVFIPPYFSPTTCKMSRN